MPGKTPPSLPRCRSTYTRSHVASGAAAAQRRRQVPIMQLEAEPYIYVSPRSRGTSLTAADRVECRGHGKDSGYAIWSVGSRQLRQPRMEAGGKLVTESNLSLRALARIPAQFGTGSASLCSSATAAPNEHSVVLVRVAVSVGIWGGNPGGSRVCARRSRRDPAEGPDVTATRFAGPRPSRGRPGWVELVTGHKDACPTALDTA